MKRVSATCLFILSSALAGCLRLDTTPQVPTPFPTLSPTPAPPTLMPTPSITPDFTSTPPIQPTITLAPSPTPSGCDQRPIDEYARLPIGEWTLSERTLSMLVSAQMYYAGPNDIILSITQGSFNPGVEASFGTHDGGGAVDLSVYNQGPEAGRLDEAQIQELVLALRGAGFAAWHRAVGDLYPGSPPHVHAIAIGDAELSTAATDQLTGPNGYFRGRNGLPGSRGAPDRHGGPIVCQWMLDAGYADLR